MSKVFTLMEETAEQVVIKVTAVDNYVIATHPYISGDYDYITITRGKNHIFTIIYKDGHTWSFSWGDRGTTMISDGTRRLKEKVLKFLEEECHILIGWDGIKRPTDEICIYCNPNWKQWQLSIRSKSGDAYWWSDTATDHIDMEHEVAPFVGNVKWFYQKAQTGLDTWRAYRV